MARTNAVNFSGALQFPMASAGTDLFLKEDVQTLAKAVDGHDHSGGKGALINGSSVTGGPVDVTDYVRARGNARPTSGAGSYLYYDGTTNQGGLIVGNSGTSTFQDLYIQGRWVILSNDISGQVSFRSDNKLYTPAGAIQLSSLETITQGGAGSSDGSTYTRSTPNSPAAVPGVGSVALTFIGGQVRISGLLYWTHTVAGALGYSGYMIDGAWTPITVEQCAVAGGYQATSFSVLASVSAGAHTIQLAWDMGSVGTMTRGNWWSYVNAQEFRK